MAFQFRTIATVVTLFLSSNVLAADQSARDRSESIIPDGWEQFAGDWQFAPAIKVDNRIYVSGVIAAPRDGDIKEGYRRAWRTIEQMLVKAGSSLDDIVEMTTFHTDIANQMEDFRAVKSEFIKAPYPAWTGIGTSGLVLPQGVVEIKVTAHIKDD